MAKWLVALLSAAALSFASTAQAQNYPTTSVTPPAAAAARIFWALRQSPTRRLTATR